MAKISALPVYDQSTANINDFVPTVQAGVTKRLNIADLTETRERFIGALSSNPMAAEFVAIVGTPSNSGDFIIKDIDGPQNVYWVVYDKTADEWWYERLTMA